MDIYGKKEITCTIEYELYMPKIRCYDNKPEMTVMAKFNKKQLRTVKRYAKKLSKLLTKMNKVGFVVKEVEVKENE